MFAVVKKVSRMKYVYILQSIKYPNSFYVGCTRDLKVRLNQHNEGKSPYTNKFKPWKVKTYIGFTDPIKAEKFEAYLKSGTGRIFQKKHF
jgi:predicted GIY-YIG superfamily endonuclease